MVPVRVADDDVGDGVRLYSRKLHGFIWPEIVLHGEIFQKSVAMIAAIEKNVMAATADEPNDHGDVDFFVLGAAYHHLGQRKTRSGSIEDRLDGIFGRRGAVSQRRNRRRKNHREKKSFHVKGLRRIGRD